MHNNTTKGLALLLTLVATAIYSYCCFLGLDFWLEGSIVVSGLIIVVALMILWCAMSRMIKSKTRRNAREGKQMEWKWGVVVMVVILMGCPFFSKFMEINDYAKDGMLEECIDSTLVSARGIDSCYKAYAKERVSNVPRKYRKSLKRRLIPEQFDSIASERKEWLSKLSRPNIWNIYTATNMNHLMTATEKWGDEYAAISSVIYEVEDEEVTVFEYPRSDDEITRFRQMTGELHAPDWRGWLAVALCFCIMMTSYWVTRRVKTGVE